MSFGPNQPKRRTAYDLRARFAWLNQFSDDELRDISLCDEREPLEDGMPYLDASQPEHGVIMGRNGERAPEGSCYVARGRVSQQTWDKLQHLPRTRQTGL